MVRVNTGGPNSGEMTEKAVYAESMSPMVFDGQVIMMPYDFVIL